jgi:hypothetical protein
VLHFVRERDHVSFVELEKRFGAKARGHWTMTMASDDKVVLWGGMSDELSTAIRNLSDLHLVELRPASSPLTYVLDGRIPDLPVFEGVPEGGLQEPHWLPTLLCRPKESRDVSRDVTRRQPTPREETKE